jgi:predicted anti-sigma-YlaC factor YlaD
VDAGTSRTEATRRVGQSVRVIEGGRAAIGIGVAIPFSFNQWVASAQGLTEVVATTYYEAVTGFAVRPLLAGEVVTLELSPTDATITPQGIERAQLVTRVQGRLGEWIALGGADLAEQARRGGVISSDARAASSQRGVWVRVEDVTGR